jgi:hypothetical protein
VCQCAAKLAPSGHRIKGAAKKSQSIKRTEIRNSPNQPDVPCLAQVAASMRLPTRRQGPSVTGISTTGLISHFGFEIPIRSSRCRKARLHEIDVLKETRVRLIALGSDNREAHKTGRLHGGKLNDGALEPKGGERRRCAGSSLRSII